MFGGKGPRLTNALWVIDLDERVSTMKIDNICDRKSSSYYYFFCFSQYCQTLLFQITKKFYVANVRGSELSTIENYCDNSARGNIDCKREI